MTAAVPSLEPLSETTTSMSRAVCPRIASQLALEPLAPVLHRHPDGDAGAGHDGLRPTTTFPCGMPLRRLVIRAIDAWNPTAAMRSTTSRP